MFARGCACCRRLSAHPNPALCPPPTLYHPLGTTSKAPAHASALYCKCAAGHKHEKEFNCVQRGHQNSLEVLASFNALLLAAGIRVSVCV